jgi:hypothetical protein
MKEKGIVTRLRYILINLGPKIGTTEDVKSSGRMGLIIASLLIRGLHC